MHQREPGGHPGIAQIREVPGQLGRREHALVDDRAAGEAGQRDLGPGGALDHPADHVQLALKRALIVDVVVGLDDDLADDRGRQPRGLADIAVIDGHVAPPQHLLPLGGDGLLDQLLERPPALGIARQVADSYAIAARGRQVDSGHRAAHEGIGDLQQDPGAVARVGISALGAPVLHVLQSLQGLLHHGVAGLAPQLRHQGDAAAVVLICGVVEASGRAGPLSKAVHEAVPGKTRMGRKALRPARRSYRTTA